MLDHSFCQKLQKQRLPGSKYPCGDTVYHPRSVHWALYCICDYIFCISACQSSNSCQLNCKMIRENLVLFSFCLVFIIICGVEVSVQFVLGIIHMYTDWFAYAMGFPIAELVLPLGFLFYMYTIINHPFNPVSMSTSHLPPPTFPSSSTTLCMLHPL